ncbi:MAG TPA: DUF4132 domain-containing protein [Tepidisphaeraceae bacterium]|nr:DUF4132 domain-containing protein [Tepidisphaeraceae bacterium]
MPKVQAIEAEAEKLLVAAAKSWPTSFDYRFNPQSTPQGKAVSNASADVRRAAVIILLEWLREPLIKVKVFGTTDARRGVHAAAYVRGLAAALLRSKLPFDAVDGERLFKLAAGAKHVTEWSLPLAGLVAAAERLHEAGALSDEAKQHLATLRRKLEQVGAGASSRKLIAGLNGINGSGSINCIVAGEAWSDRALADQAAMKEKPKAAWAALLAHAAGASSARPTGAWEKRAAEMISDVGDAGEFEPRALAWLELVPKPRTQPWPHAYAQTEQTDLLINEGNADVLRGLAWMLARPDASADACRALGRLCETSLKKLPGIGPRLPKLANAAVWSLGRIGGEHALGQLARLKTRITFRTTLQQIDKALDEAAQRLGVTKADLEELGVPAYGFDEHGVRRQTFGGATCVLKLDGRDVVTTWTNDKGKIVKSPPAGVKEKHADELKELKAAAADAEKMLTAQRDRIDALMGIPKTWKLADLRARYLDHPIVGQIARRLIWVADATPVLFIAGDATDVAGKKVKLGQAAEVALWHPAERTMDDVVAWRRRLEELKITQPFKQAHREVYLLTDAERRTRNYSNRFAAHVIRQHQFHALAAQRGWRNKLRLMVDDTYPPASKKLPHVGLRAEFWIEGIGDNYGTDTTDSGSYLRLATDQLRFYRLAAAGNSAHAAGGGYTADAAGPGAAGVDEPVALEDVPPLALSEVMRDVDLFVGVASVGNDPNWMPEGNRVGNYWHAYSFGNLSASAETRRAVLERLVPRLKIAERASISGKFLVVKGSLRTYKIHLGSGNVLMEPNDQYLCIVPARGGAVTAGNGGDGVFLPFEGDHTLSVILSKAFLLADDRKIDDPTITRQIEVTT